MASYRLVSRPAPELKTPFHDVYWTIAGATGQGVIYVVSKDETKICLWSYNSITKKWTRLATTVDLPFVHSTYNGNIVADFDELRRRIDVFVRPYETTAAVIRFVLGQSHQCRHVILWPTSPIPYRLTYGKNGLFHFDDTLVFVASERACPYAPIRLRLIRIEPHHQSETFSWTQMWTSDTIGQEVRDVAKVGDKLLVMVSNKIIIFQPNQFGTSTWESSILTTTWPSTDVPWRRSTLGYLGSCTTPGVTDRLWIMRDEKWVEVILTPSGQLLFGRSHEFAPGEHGKIELCGVTSSPSHLFVFEQYEASYCGRWSKNRIFSKVISPPSLQYISLDSLFSLPAFQSCDTEQKAAQLGIAVPAWRTFCK